MSVLRGPLHIQECSSGSTKDVVVMTLTLSQAVLLNPMLTEPHERRGGCAAKTGLKLALAKDDLELRILLSAGVIDIHLSS